MAATKSTTNPATGKTLSQFELISTDEAKSVVRNSNKAFADWSKMAIKQRLKIIGRIGELLTERKENLSLLMTREMGKKPAHAQDEIDLCAAICQWTADNAADELADEQRDFEGGKAVISYCPQGVILGIQPWNFPFYQAVRYSIPNLAAGNTVLLKHASNVWGCAEALHTLYKDAGLPEKVFSLLFCEHETIDELIPMREIRGVTLTGSDKAGRHVAELAGKNLKKTVMELGSNDAYIVMADADIEQAAELAVQGRTYNNGETCVAAKRFIVVESVYEPFRDALKAGLAALKSGPPENDDSDIGPMAREDLRDDLHEQVEDSVKAGATLLLGGKIPETEGYYYPASLLDDVKPGMPAYDDELFGPVASLIKAKDADDAMRIANDSRYGLGGGIFSKDEAAAIKLARDHFDTDMVNINGYALAQPNLPFGGVKDSGYGREHGGFGVKEFVNVKSIMTSTSS